MANTLAVWLSRRPSPPFAPAITSGFQPELERSFIRAVSTCFTLSWHFAAFA